METRKLYNLAVLLYDCCIIRVSGAEETGLMSFFLDETVTVHAIVGLDNMKVSAIYANANDQNGVK